MKKIFEGSSIVSAILLITTVACAFIFNVKNQKDRSKAERHEEKMLEKAERKFDSQRVHDKEEIQRLRKLNDPLWNYYDPYQDEFKPLPGKYGKEDPPGYPREY